jgi:hypothetical protein
MRFSPVSLSLGLGALLAVVATTAHGQQIVVAQAAQEKAPPPKSAEKAPPASVHKMTIFEGAHRRVNYITSGNLSTADQLTAYDLERAENELAYVRDLQRLKQQYAHSERIMEPQRRYVQEQLYGTQISYAGSSGYYGGYGGRGYYPYAFGSYGWSRGFTGFAGSTSYSVVRTLQYGMGDEGIVKNSIAPGMAREGSPEHAAFAVRTYDTVAARATASPTLSRDLSLQKGPAYSTDHCLSFAKGSKVTVWVGNDKYQGTVKDDSADWVVLQTGTSDVTVRKSEITRSEVPSK